MMTFLGQIRAWLPFNIGADVHSARWRLASSTFWMLLGAVVSQGMGLITSILLARILQKEGFGQWGYLNSTISTIAIFSGISLGGTATKYVAQFRDQQPQRAGNVLGLALWTSGLMTLLISLVLFFASPAFADYVMHRPVLTDAVRAASVFLLVNTLFSMLISALAGFESFRNIAIVNAANGLLQFPVTLAGAHFGGLTGALWATVLVSAVTCVALWMLLWRECTRYRISISYRFVPEEAHILWQFSLPVFLAGIITPPTAWAVNTLLINQPHGYEEMGRLTVAGYCYMVVMFIPLNLMATSLSLLCNSSTSMEPKRYRRFVWGNVLLTAFIAIAIGVPIILASPWIMRAYRLSAPSDLLFVTLAVAWAALTAANCAVGTAITASSNVWWKVAFNAMYALVFFGCATIFIKYGSIGILLAQIPANMLQLVLQCLYLHTAMNNRVRALPDINSPNQSATSNLCVVVDSPFVQGPHSP